MLQSAVLGLFTLEILKMIVVASFIYALEDTSCTWYIQWLKVDYYEIADLDYLLLCRSGSSCILR